MLAPLLLSAAMIIGTVAFHMAGLSALMAFMQARSPRLRPFHSRWRQALFIILTVLGLVVIHAVEMWAYALVYRALDLFSSMEEALYFSISTFTTVGFGEIVVENKWRLLSALESFNGFLLIGWSTAFLVAVIGRLRSMEMDWLDSMWDGMD